MIIDIGGSSSRDYISISISNNTATAFRQEDGTIRVDLGEIDEKPSEKIVNKFSNKERNSLMLFIVLFIVSLFIKEYKIIPLINEGKLGNFWYLVPMGLCILAVFFMIFLIRKHGGERLLKNHGAEHTVINAYEKLMRLPTIKECKSFSRIAYSCGGNNFCAIITGQLIGFIIYCFTGKAISEILLVIIPLIFCCCTPFNFLGMFLQHFTTSKPDDESIELAIAALSAVLSLEKESSK